jgi:asparagine synthase (glutamine-hydrolysing)
VYRYVALIWNAEAESQEHAASLISLRLRNRFSDYGIAISRAGLLVLTAGGQDSFGNHLLKNNRGIILGSIFERKKDLDDDSPSNRAIFDSRLTEAVIASRGRALVSDHWGNYVAILTTDQSRSILILKDPTGSLPCLITLWRGVSIVFSCLQDCLDLSLMPFSVNWANVETRLASNGADESNNPVNELSQVNRGECLELIQSGSRLGKRQLYWQPLDFSQRADAIDDVTSAKKALRACVRASIHTLAAGHSDILVRLSGGLDSSIIAGCLKSVATTSTMTAYTYLDPGARSSERRWAHLSAQHAEIPHIECIYDSSCTSLEPALRMAACARPPTAAGHVMRSAIEQRLGEHRHYTAVFSGDGGDAVFGSEAVRHVVDDFLRLQGMSASVISLAAAVALRTDTLTWRVLAAALKRRIWGSTMNDFRGRFINKQSLAADHLRNTGLRSKSFPHPWFSGINDVPWHVIRRVGALILAPEFYDPMRKSATFAPLDMAPLYSQPVVELSLRIPLYAHFVDGRDRGLARDAFAADVPAAILRRLWKDRAPGSFEALAHRNRDLIRETVLGGALAQSGLINCAAIEKILGGEFSKGGYFIGELFALFDLELWLRHFTTPTAQRVAA